MAVAHAILVSVFHMLTRREPYHELGAHYIDERRRHSTVDRLAQRIERLGYRVHLELVATTAVEEIFKATGRPALPRRTARRVHTGRNAPGPRKSPASSGSKRVSSMKRCTRRGNTRRPKPSRSTMRCGPALKARCRRGYGPLIYGGRATSAPRKTTPRPLW